MTTKSELKYKLSVAERQLQAANATLEKNAAEKRRLDSENIQRGLIPIEMLLDVQLVEDSRSNKAQVTIRNAEVIAKLRAQTRTAARFTFDKIAFGKLAFDKIAFDDIAAGRIAINPIDLSRIGSGVVGGINTIANPNGFIR